MHLIMYTISYCVAVFAEAYLCVYFQYLSRLHCCSKVGLVVSQMTVERLTSIAGEVFLTITSVNGQKHGCTVLPIEFSMYKNLQLSYICVLIMVHIQYKIRNTPK